MVGKKFKNWKELMKYEVELDKDVLIKIGKMKE